MGRPKKNDDEEKIKPPKRLLKLTLDIFDNGVVDPTMESWLFNDDIMKRKKYTRDNAAAFMQDVKSLVSEDPAILATHILASLNIDPQVYARSVLGKVSTAGIPSSAPA